MPSFDMIKSAGSAYQLVWTERHYLFKLAIIPCVMKFLCYFLIFVLGWEENFIRQALILLPSYFADGWLLSHLVRLVFLEQRWPFRPSGNINQDMKILQDRAFGIMAGTLTFVVTKFLLAGIVFVIIMLGQERLMQDTQDVSPMMFFLMLGFLAFSVWAFRFLWLYIPAALHCPLSYFLRTLGGYKISWHLLGTWLLCFLPLFFVLGKLLSLMEASAGDVAAGFEVHVVTIICHILLDTGVAVLTTIAMATGFKDSIIPQYSIQKNGKL